MPHMSDLEEATQDLALFTSSINALSRAKKETEAEAAEERPAKFQRDGNKGLQRGKGDASMNRGRQTGSHRRGHGPSGASNWSKPASAAATLQEVAALCHRVCRLAVRHEDQLNVLRLSSGMVMFMSTQKPASLIPSLWQISNDWKDMKEHHPERLRMPLRVTLMQHILSELKGRIVKIEQDPAALKQAEELGIYGDRGFPFLRWDAQEQKHIAQDKEPLSLAHAKEIADELTILVTRPEVLTSFHAKRPLAETMEGNVVPFILELGWRGAEAAKAWELFSRLHHCSCTKLVGLVLREERLHRAPLATQIVDLLPKPSQGSRRSAAACFD